MRGSTQMHLFPQALALYVVASQLLCVLIEQ